MGVLAQCSPLAARCSNMGLLDKLGGLLGKKKPGQPADVSETVSDAVGGGLVGLAVGELVEKGAKAVAKKRAPKKKVSK